MTKLNHVALVLIALLARAVVANADDGVHLFVLSGQSNMQGHRPQEAFTPAVAQALGKENVLVIQDALGGQPIQRSGAGDLTRPSPGCPSDHVAGLVAIRDHGFGDRAGG